MSDAIPSTSQTPSNPHLGNLTPEQALKYTEFKSLCEKEGVYEPGKTRPSLTEGTLIRYLRARKYDPAEALHQLKDTEAWRKANKLDELYDSFDVNAYEDGRKVYHQWTGRRDLTGRPLYVYEISTIKDNMAAFERSSKIAAVPATDGSAPIPGKLRVLFALYENMSEYVLPLANAVPTRPNRDEPVFTTTHIVDLSNMSLMQYWNLKSHMQAASTLASAHYPETLERMFMVGTPSFFPTVWGWIKRWFDPVTTSKIFILSADEVKPTLLQHIRSEDIPKKYGGTLDWAFGDSPKVDEEIVKTAKGLSAENPLRGPVRWVKQADGTAKVVARGVADGKGRNEVVAECSHT
ncbi:unnamed protein product [Mycena citricolor]|uniref:CRAL-TRIO domain-containing protein n=1 Tax=Mycena citricolor TaxID=2018698 RepID=A0AAD2HN83_9AGAR|nr:unnamed protein product [Mycena citricolor]